MQSFKYLGINVPSTNRWNECYEFNKNLMEDEYHLLLVCSIDNVIREKYDDLLDGHGNFSFIPKYPRRRVGTYVLAFFSYTEFLLLSNRGLINSIVSITNFITLLEFGSGGSLGSTIENKSVSYSQHSSYAIVKRLKNLVK